MKKQLFVFCFLGVTFLSGCSTFQPVGPMASVFTSASAAPKKVAPGVSVSEPVDAPEGPSLVTAPPPPSPTFLITPGEVQGTNTADAIARLRQEIDADTKALDQFPKYAEVSKIGK
jgi:hypothetical protein